MSGHNGLLVIERILRDRTGVWRQIANDHELESLSGSMLGSASIALAGYGAVLGASNGWLQALASAVKLPLLFFLTLLICLPTLYLFNLVYGARLSVRQALALVSVAITVIAMLSVAFAPISLFFLVTAPHYMFYKILNVAILTLTGIVGLRFLIGGMRSLNTLTGEAAGRVTAPPAAIDSAASTEAETSAEPAEPATPIEAVTAVDASPPYYRPIDSGRPANMGLLYVWVVVFGFVGTQLAWTLRPFLGSPDESFEIVRAVEGNFYVDVIGSLGRLFG